MVEPARNMTLDELLAQPKARDHSLPVVLNTGHGDNSMADGAMRDGAYDFMEKPFSPERLVDVTRRALEQRRLAREVAQLRRQLTFLKMTKDGRLGRDWSLPCPQISLFA